MKRLLPQLLLVALVVGLALWLALATGANLRERGIQSGFDFLLQPAGFAIGEGVFAFDAGDSYLLAFLAGLANTLRVAAPALLLALTGGALIGIGRRSANALLRLVCGAYVEVFRNLPLLLQLLVWYFLLTDLLPAPGEALVLAPHVFLSKAGLAVPWWSEGAVDLPEAAAFGIAGGASLTPEFLALWLGLACYTAAYVAETVRAGLQAVPVGQTDAALALGMSGRQTLRQVTLPQALPIVLPPLTNQALNLIKNSSLAVAIGYPDLVSVSNTALNQTGRAAECLAVVVAVYLLLSLMTAGVARRLERRSW